MQIVGKLKLELVPFLNEWWQVGFTVTARGLPTQPSRWGAGSFRSILTSSIIASTCTSTTAARVQSACFPFGGGFLSGFMARLDELGRTWTITKNPVEFENTIPYDQDNVHRAYDAPAITRRWRILLQTDRLLQAFRTPLCG